MTTSQTQTPESPNTPRNPWVPFSALAIQIVTGVASQTMVFVALAEMAGDFGVTLRTISWVVIVQGLTISAVMMPMGRLGDIIGRRRVYLLGLVIFGLGMASTAASPVFGILIGARIVSAIGNSMVQSVSTAMTVSLFPENERGKALGLQATLVATGLATGPVAAGILLQFFSWESIFIMILVPTAISFALGYFLLTEKLVSSSAPSSRPPFDWTGAVVSALIIVVGVVLINNPFKVSAISPIMLGGAVGVVALVIFFIKWELRTEAPMLQLRLFKNRQLSLGVSVRYLGFLGQTAPTLLMPIYLIGVRDLEEAAAGGLLFLTSIGMGSAAQLSGRLGDRFGERMFQVFGFAILTIVAITYSTFTADTPIGLVMAILALNGFGLGSWAVSNNSVVVGSAPRNALGVVGALTNLTRNVGSVTGQAVATTIVAGAMASRGFDIPLDEVSGNAGAISAFMAGWRYAYLTVAGFAITSMILATLAGSVPKADEAEVSKPG
ncbi:MAG: MFS transporter [Chloroflexi bacterium]|jgi:MFS family permease|nr:MFS transporter [Chloroflexota bacterium]